MALSISNKINSFDLVVLSYICMFEIAIYFCGWDQSDRMEADDK